MSHSDALGATPRTSGALDGPVLVSNLVAGALGLVVLAVLSWPLAVAGAAYVATASVFLAAVYARPALGRRQEGLAWVAAWLGAVALWTWVLAGVESGTSTWPLAVWPGLVVGTACCLVWQALALAVRQLWIWRAKPTSP